MAYFRSKSSQERVKTLARVMSRLEKEQADEDTPPVDTNDLLRMLRYLTDHLIKLEDEWEVVGAEED